MRNNWTTSRDFGDLCKAIALAGNWSQLEVLTSRSAEDVRDVVRAATDPATISAHPGFGRIAAPFLESLGQGSILDRVLADGAATAMPYTQTSVNLSLTAIAGGSVAEGAPKPIRGVSFDAATLGRHKAVSMVVASEELLRAPGAAQAITAELRRALSQATNQVFLDALIVGADTQAGSGSTAAAILADITAAIQTVGAHERSRFYLAVSPDTLAELALKPSSATVGPLAFGDLQVDGGTVQGITVMASESLTTDAVLFDAGRLAIGDGGLMIDQARHANVEMDDDPQANSSAAVSLWQRNLRGIRAERLFSLAFASDTSATLPAVRITSAW